MRKLAWLGLLVAPLLFPSFAGAAQHPRALPHPPAPFGSHSKAVCPPQPGKAQCFALTLTNSAGATVVNALPSGYGPADLQTAYNLAALSASNGAGKTVAIVDAFDDPSAEADLAVYRSTYGLSPCTTANGCFMKVDQNGGTNYPVANAGWAAEISLDLDMVSAIAPNAHILLVEANDNTWNNLATAVNEAASLRANAISNSYGGDERFGSAVNSYYNHPGIAVTASSGDSGWDGCSGGPCFPASSQYVEAVGGTSLTSTNPRVESAWAGAGSGCSNIFPKPPWQTDSGCPKRTVADVSVDADPSTGVAVYDSQPDIGGWAIFGGTSVSSPMFAAFDALVDATASTPTPGWPYAHVNVWNDVTTGSNGNCGTYICNAGPGYDGPTGLGTPNGANTSPVNAQSEFVRSDGEVDVVAEGRNHSLMYYFSFPGGPMIPIQVAGPATTYSQPAIFVRSTGEADIVAEGPNGSLDYYYNFPSGPFIHIQIAPAGTTYLAPSIFVRSTGEADIVAAKPDGSLMYWFNFPSGPFVPITVAGPGTTLMP